MTALPTFGACDRCGQCGPLAATLRVGDRVAAVCSDCESVIDALVDLDPAVQDVADQVWQAYMAAL